MAESSEVLNLLQIANLAAQWPHLRSIHDHAMRQLEKIAEGNKPAVPEPTAPVAPARRPYLSGER